MKKLVVFVVVCGWLFAMLDWKVIQYTRLEHPELTQWMHSQEQSYAIVSKLEGVICPPAVALKPMFYNALMGVEAAEEQQSWITHAPKPSWKGFYHLIDRKYSWTFVPWFAWILYWMPPSLLWWSIIKKIGEGYGRKH